MSKRATLLFLTISICVFFLYFLKYEKLILRILQNDRQEWKSYTSYGIKLPPDYAVHGIDVSLYQGAIDWDRVKSMNVQGVKISFAFIRATVGHTGVDDYFKYNWRETKNVGIIRGAYHYFKPTQDTELQANLFAKTVKLQAGDLPPVLDTEVLGNLSSSQLRAEVKLWLDLVEKKTGVRPIIYTNYIFYRDNFHGYFNDYKFWIAHYNAGYLNLPGFADWTFWQHTDKGRVASISHRVDFNVFNGNKEQLNTLCLKTAPKTSPKNNSKKTKKSAK